MSKIVCVGCAIVDVIISGVEVEKDCLNLFFDDTFHYVDNIHLSLGGDALNEAITLSYLKNDISLVCGIGKDIAGKLILDCATNAGIDTRSVVVHPSEKTMINTLLVQRDTEKYYFSEPPSLSASFKVPEDAFANASVVSLASLCMEPFNALTNILDTLTSAKSAGAKTCADVSLTPKSVLKPEELIIVYPYIDYFIPNLQEAMTLTKKETPEEMAEFFLLAGVKNVIIKMGRYGCYYQNSEESGYIPVFPCKSVDATGAGDSFVAGFLHAKSRGNSLKESCRFGNAVASLVVQQIGATPNEFCFKQVEALLKGQKGKNEICD